MTGRVYTFANGTVRIDIVGAVDASGERYSQLIGFQHHDEVEASERAREVEPVNVTFKPGVP